MAANGRLFLKLAELAIHGASEPLVPSEQAKPYFLRRQHLDLIVRLPSAEQHIEGQQYHVPAGA